ncbi:MAG: PDZ domain-containing protein [Lysobacterales bacterium]|jgi:hypothetical protein
MKLHNTLITLATALLLGFCPVTFAQAQEEAELQAAEAELRAAEATRQAELKAEYAEAIAEAELEQQDAEAAIARARESMERAAAQRARSAEDQAQARDALEAEMNEMYRELARARDKLNETSREIAHLNREVARERARTKTGGNFVITTVQKPVIGVILGNTTDEGIQIIGVSPDGPAERAGIEKGDVLVSMAGKNLATDDEKQSEANLEAAKQSLEEGEAIVVTYRRNDKLVDVNVTPEVREPLAWHTVTRFPSIVAAPDELVTVERIVVPELDTAELAERIAQIKVEVAERARLAAPAAPPAPSALEHTYDIEFHELSELGDTALYQANAWFGLPVTRGLKLAELNPGLGEYFKAERGVLVLEARADNELQLETGDVVLKVGATEVNTPAEFMRAMREAEPGAELAIDIKRERRNKTLKTTMPERKKLGYLISGHPLDHDFEYRYKIATD